MNSNELRFQTIPEFQPLVDPSDPNYYCTYKGFWGGRSGAKSIQLCRGAIFRSYYKKMRILCAREYQVSISDSILSVLAEHIEILGLSDFFDVQRRYIYGKNGTEFIFKGLYGNTQSIKSTFNIDLCLVDESQSVSEDSWEVLIPTVIREPNSELWVGWNPQEDTDPTQKRFIDDPPPNSYICNVNYDRNPWLSDVTKAQIAYDKKRDYNLYLHKWRGHTRKRTEALVFKHWRVDGTISPAEDETLYYGGDFGFSQDPATLVRMWVNDDKREICIDYEAHGFHVEIDKLEDLYDRVPGSRKWKIVADSSRPDTISYLKRKGFKIVGSKKGKGSVDEGVTFLQSYNIVVHPRCIHTIAELGCYSWKVHPKTKEILPVLVDADNHIIDALRYALESLMKRSRIHIG